MVVMVALPMIAAVIAVAALTVLGRRLEVELVALRGTLRRATATAVAADELSRSGAEVGRRAVRTGREARAAIGRSRTGAPRPPR